MRVSRRRVLAAAPVAAALALLPHVRWGGRRVVDVTTLGATGDGTTDDSAAIRLAVAAMQSGCTLHFPAGTYRFAQRWPVGSAAIVVTRVTDVAVDFAPGAELLMDNLDPIEHTGTSHGILIRGPASRISLRNISIRWANGAIRSLGDGIRAEGFPTLDGGPPAGWSGRPTPVDGITISDCSVRASPQAGVVMHGVSDIAVNGLQVVDTRADGLHFNACRQTTITGYRATNTGDDGLALVTYYASTFSFENAAHTFALPALTDWSNADFAIEDVRVEGSQANGIRVAGAHRVTVGSLHVTGAGAGSAVMVDSAAPGTDVGWNYVASRAVHVKDLVATASDTGIHLLARPGTAGDELFTAFDVKVDRATLDDCSNWSVRAESLAAVKATGLRVDDCKVSATSTAGGNGAVGLENTLRMSLGSVSIRHSGAVTAFAAAHTDQMAVDHLDVAITDTDQASGAVPPCVTLDDSSGVIVELDVNWPAAPEGWSAVRESVAGQCSAQHVIVRSLNVTPSQGDSAPACS